MAACHSDERLERGPHSPVQLRPRALFEGGPPCVEANVRSEVAATDDPVVACHPPRTRARFGSGSRTAVYSSVSVQRVLRLWLAGRKEDVCLQENAAHVVPHLERDILPNGARQYLFGDVHQGTGYLSPSGVSFAIFKVRNAGAVFTVVEGHAGQMLTSPGLTLRRHSSTRARQQFLRARPARIKQYRYEKPRSARAFCRAGLSAPQETGPCSELYTARARDSAVVYR